MLGAGSQTHRDKYRTMTLRGGPWRQQIQQWALAPGEGAIQWDRTSVGKMENSGTKSW